MTRADFDKAIGLVFSGSQAHQVCNEYIKSLEAELEALQSRSCDGCVHLDRGRFCTLPASNHCIRDAEDYFKPKDK